MATPATRDSQSSATADEKRHPSQDTSSQDKKHSKKQNKEDNSSSVDSHEEAFVPVDPSKAFVRRVGFTELFRYATPLELTLNGLTLICAAASGAAQVCSASLSHPLYFGLMGLS